MEKQNTVIERIEFSKPRRLIYTLFYSDGTQQEVREETLLHFGLAQGSIINANLEDKIKQYEQEVSCKEQAYRYLARRPHLEKELANKLRSKSYSSDLVSKTIRYLKDRNLLNDSDFIHRFAEEEKKLRHSGPLRIKKKLLTKGASVEMIDEWLKRFYPEQEQMRQAKILAEKKYLLLHNYPQQKRIQKIQSFLQQKGYYWYVIRETVAGWLEEANDL